MKTSPNDVSNQEILLELKKLAASDGEIRVELNKLSHMMEEGFKTLEKSDQDILETTNEFATDVDIRLTALEKEQVRLRMNMVTKEYLDDKMADLHSDIVQHTRKEIAKASH